tara:strand:+ start:51 stop:431 length:381 start_codon:yes stop_codon:yes gene_type:complete
VISLAAAKTKKKLPVKQGKNREVGYKKPPVGKRFKKGTSGNPNGRPKSGFALNEYITELANIPVGKTKKTMLEAVVAKVYEEALNGNMTAVAYLSDRILGKPNQSIGIKDTTDEPIKVFDIDGLED